jgi:hypothetical protein
LNGWGSVWYTHLLPFSSVQFSLSLRFYGMDKIFLHHRQVSKLDQLVTVQCVAINTHGQRFTTQHPSTMDHVPIAKCHSSDEGYFIMWTQAGHQFMEISYKQIGLSIDETYCCVMTCSLLLYNLAITICNCDTST